MNSRFTVLVSLLALSLAPSAFGQAPQQSALRPYIQSLADSLGKGRLESPNLNMMGREPIPSDQFRRYATLCDSATTEELTYLTNDTSAVVRCYSFDALERRKPKGFLRLALNHMNDTAAFQVQFFDVVDWQTVSDHLKEVVLPEYFEANPPDTSEYALLRTLVISKEVPEAIIALAKFHKPEDVQIISSYFSDPRLQSLALIATREFPAEQLFSKLTDVHKALLSNDFPSLDICGPLYEAIVQYKTPETLSILKESLSNTKGFAQSIQKVAIYVALSKYPDPYFQDVKKLINLSLDEQRAADELLKQ